MIALFIGFALNIFFVLTGAQSCDTYTTEGTCAAVSQCAWSSAQSKCLCGSKLDLDVVIISDSSGSIGGNNFPKVRSFAASLIGFLGQTARVGLINFSGDWCNNVQCVSTCTPSFLAGETRKWCFEWKPRFQCSGGDTYTCPADDMPHIRTEVALGSPDSLWNNGFANAISKANNMQYFDGGTYTVAALRVATDMFKDNGRANAAKKIFLLTDGRPDSYFYEVNPCVSGNGAGWSKNTDLAGIELILVKFGNFDSSTINCLAEYNAQGEISNFISTNGFDQASLDDVLQNLAADACPVSEKVAITEVKPVNSPLNPGLGIPTADANSRFIELWNRGTDINFATTTLNLTGIVEGLLDGAITGNYLWKANTFLIIYSNAVPSVPYCRRCDCTYAAGTAGFADQNNGQCTNAKYIAASSPLKFNPATMTGWEVKVSLGTKLLDEVKHGAGFPVIISGFSYERKVSSYDALNTAGSTGTFWQESCMAFGTPGDDPLNPCTQDYPSKAPTARPTSNPTKRPTDTPTSKNPTRNPTANPTQNPTKNPTPRPTKEPTIISGNPTISPTPRPTGHPTTPRPTSNPTSNPTKNPTANPTQNPTANPTKNPSKGPTPAPTSPCRNCNGNTGNVATCPPPYQLQGNQYTFGSSTIFCCTGNQFVRVGQGATTGACTPIPTLAPPPSCVISITGGQTTNDERGTATWTSPLPGDTTITYRLFTSAITFYSQTFSQQGVGPITTKRTQNEPRLAYSVEASKTDTTTGIKLTSTATACTYLTVGPTPRPVTQPTVPVSGITCTVTIVGGKNNEGRVVFQRSTDSRALAYALFPSNNAPISLLRQSGNPVDTVFPFEDFKNNPTTASVQVGILLSYQQDPATIPPHLRYNCTIETVAPSATPTKNPTANPTSNPTSNPTKNPTGRPTYAQGTINSCTCSVLAGGTHYTVSADVTPTPQSPSYRVNDTSGSTKITAVTLNTQEVRIDQQNNFFGQKCFLELTQNLYPGNPVKGPWVPCTIATKSPTANPTSNPTANPTRNPTANPVTSQPTAQPTSRPTCTISLPTCEVTLGGGTSGSATISLGATWGSTLSGIGTTGLEVQFQQRVSGQSWIRKESIASTDASPTVQSGLNYASTTQFRIIVYSGSNPFQSCNGNLQRPCTRFTPAPTTTPTRNPTGSPTLKPTHQTAAVYIGSEYLACTNKLDRCQCKDALTPGCTNTGTNFVYNSVMGASVTEDDNAVRTFLLKRIPTTPPTYGVDTKVSWELYIDTSRANLLQFLLPQDRSSVAPGQTALAQQADVTATGGSLSGTSTIKGNENEARVSFTFPVDADGTEFAYLVIKKVTYGPNNLDGVVFYPSVVRIAINANPSALQTATVSIGQMPWWVWAIIAAAIMLLAAVGFMAYRRYKKSLATKAKAAEIDKEIADLDAEDDPMALDANDVQMNPLATGVKGAEYANLGDTFDAARTEARETVELANVDVDRVNFRSEFGAVKPVAQGFLGGAGGGAAMGGQMVQETVVRQEYVVVQNRGSVY